VDKERAVPPPPDQPSRRAPHQSQYLSLIVGVVYLVLGVAGLVAATSVPFAGPEGAQVAGLSVNGLSSVLHLLVGVAGIAGWRRVNLAVAVGWALAAGMLLLFLYGVAVADDALALDNSVNGVHAITAVYGLFMAIWPRGQVEASAEVQEAARRSRDRP
jgi:hypothetical protein